MQVLAEGVGKCGLASTGGAGEVLWASSSLFFSSSSNIFIAIFSLLLLKHLHVLSVPLNGNLCLSSHLNSSVLFLIYVCFKYASLPLPHPAHFITPPSSVFFPFISIPLCIFLHFASVLVISPLYFFHICYFCCFVNVFWTFSRLPSLTTKLTHTLSFLPLSQFPRWSSHLTFPRLPLANWCTSPAWWRPETCPYASRGARMARRLCPPQASPLTRRSSWAHFRYPKCPSSTMATTPASPATMPPLSALRGNSQWQVRPVTE